MLYAGKAAGVEVPREFEIEYIPSEGVERETALDRIRTEVMAGGGPDLFICACTLKEPADEREALFIMPEKAMELSLFLPLDEYMENNIYFAEWDRMNQTVLAAGRTDEGQQIIPMCYSLPVAVYRASDVEHTASKEITWTDMLESEDEALRAAAVWTDNTGLYREGMPFIASRAPMTEFILGAIADYEEEELLFTAEELEQRLSEIVDLGERYTDGEFDSVPPHYVERVGREFDFGTTVIDIDGQEYQSMCGIDRKEDCTMIPLYSDDGGVTAEIMAYIAINRNSRRAEEAYRVLDYLVSFSEQQARTKIGSLYPLILGNIGLLGSSLPMYNELLSEETRRISDVTGEKVGWYLTDHNYAELCEVREQITNVKFRDVLDKELTALYFEYYEDVRYGGDGKKVAAEGYRRIQQMVRE